jgi:hypothetical protein
VSIQQQLHRWRVQLLAQRRKFGIIMLLFTVALLLWGRLLLKAVPRTATAEPDIVDSIAAGAADNQNQSVKNRRVIQVDLPAQARRDLFSFDSTGYRAAEVRPTEEIVGKSGPLPVDQDEQLAEVREAAAGLTLQSTVPGEQPYAVINGMVVKVGDEYNGMRLIDVQNRTVLMEYRGLRFRLGM